MALSEIRPETAKLNPVNTFNMYELDVATLTADDVSIMDLTVTDDLEVFGDTDLDGKLDVGGKSTFNGNADIIGAQPILNVNQSESSGFNAVINVYGDSKANISPLVITQAPDGAATIQNSNNGSDLTITAKTSGKVNIISPVLTASPIQPSYSDLWISPSGVVNSSVLANGAILIGAGSAAQPVSATITAGAGISVTNGAGSITLACLSGTVNTYTPSFSFGGVAATGYSTQVGQYVVNGKLVTVNVALSFNGAPTIPAGSATINLPPVTPYGPTAAGACSPGFMQGITPTTGQVFLTIVSSGGCPFTQMNVGTGVSTALTNASFAANSGMILNFTYIAA